MYQSKTRAQEAKQGMLNGRVDIPTRIQADRGETP